MSDKREARAPRGGGTALEAEAPEVFESSWPTIWGLSPIELHDRFWAARKYQVVRLGSGVPVEPGAVAYLLTRSENLYVLRPDRSWVQRRFGIVHFLNQRQQGCRELTRTGDGFELQRFERVYDRPDAVDHLVYVVTDVELARVWQTAEDSTAAYEELMRRTTEEERREWTARGYVYDATSKRDVAECVKDLVSFWRNPAASIDRLESPAHGTWVDREASVHPEARFVGNVWVGAGRDVGKDESIVGPATLWDDPEHRPVCSPLDWGAIRGARTEQTTLHSPRSRPKGPPGKRLFDIVFSVAVLLVTVPLYPLIMLVIWLSDGRPFFFAHRRQGFGGREFPCLKFRTMRNDAEELKAKLLAENQADGPQFFMENDPRLLKIGKFLRKTQLDETPQFFNVILGHMSVVGPRPSPYSENQFYPEWREARLSVRPGVTGLWQVMRTREPGKDFQEWIQFDLEYVEKISWRVDLWIIWRTILHCVRDLVRILLRRKVPVPARPAESEAATVGANPAE